MALFSDEQLTRAAHAWEILGSAGLGRWLGDEKERTTKKRFFTAAEYGALVRAVRAHTGEETKEEPCTTS